MSIFKRFFNKEKPVERKPVHLFTTEHDAPSSINIEDEIKKSIRVPPILRGEKGVAMDAVIPSLQSVWGTSVPDIQVSWYSSQGFIGYQLAAVMAQHWLISRACSMPAEDAVRNGYEITVNDGSEVDPKVMDAIREADVKFDINKNLIELVQMGRIFGIRIAMFRVDSDDPDYYFKPFNPDGVKPGSYKGIVQIDPYWINPELDMNAAGNPAAPDFYEPTWWRVNSTRIHRSHLVIFRTEEVADILKPTYIYGGIPLPQKIYERVYAAERTANEAPMLALTKRTTIINTQLDAASLRQQPMDERMMAWVRTRTNYGVNVLGTDDKIEQFDTSLTDLDAVIMTQYQLVAAASGVPVVKLFGTSPKGFNATGEFEEASYHEELESLREKGQTQLLQRHHLLLIRSEIAPEFGIAPFNTKIVWNPLDSMTAKEEAEVNKINAETGQLLVNSGAIDGADERQRIITDPKSGYSGLIDEAPIEPEIESDLEDV